MEQNTLVIIKPDGVKRNIIGKLIAFYEANGLKITNLRMLQISEELAKAHYAEHIGKDFFSGLLAYITSGPSVAMILSGDNAVALVRTLNEELRRRYAVDNRQNTVHGSDSEASAEREIKIFFGISE